MPVSKLGVATKLADRLSLMGIESVLDVLQHYPRRYHDRTVRAEIAELVIGQEATVFAEVRRVASRRSRQGRAIVDVAVYDGTSLLNVVFFNQAWRERQLPVGTEAAFFGKVEAYKGKRQLTNPVVDVLGKLGENTGTVVPVYPQSGKADVFTWQLRKIVASALDWVRASGGIADPLDEPVRSELKLMERQWSLEKVHQPADLEESRRAQRRLRFDEFLRMQVGLVARKRAIEADQRGIRHRVVIDGAGDGGAGDLVAGFQAALPFPLTSDQRRTIDEILADMAADAPMHRLLQGDVGSGKTVVALTALLAAVQGGYQGALMAPTEVLAEQHYLSSAGMLAGLTVRAEGTLTGERPVTARLLTNRTPAAERRRLVAELEAGECDLIIGTHALLYGDAPIPRLGLAVIDEQHRFGVEQRAMLRARGGDGAAVPDVLVMTATPIPRTAAFLIYGDLDKSELREMPPGRTPVTTEWIGADPVARERAYQLLRDEVAAGRQAFVVCPLVEGSPKIEAKDATTEYERLAVEELAGLRLGLLHGQMKPAEKEAGMAAFRAGDVDVLVATTVIEVGVDVPNASVMIVVGAERFGLSQLHQLRGRVGRGGGSSWCFLFGDPATPDGEARLQAMADSTDGFLLAERDLEIRGAGEVFGEKQAGFGDLKLGRIPRDARYIEWARKVAEDILDDDPDLAGDAPLREEVEDLLGDDVEFLFKS
ncbi:MAG: ATP-dependent DNA helicase RecG [Acidimicrobiia bacterium]